MTNGISEATQKAGVRLARAARKFLILHRQKYGAMQNLDGDVEVTIRLKDDKITDIIVGAVAREQ